MSMTRGDAMPDTDNRSALVSGREISVRRGDRAILDHVDIAVHRDEIVTLIGPNGSGKTTLIRVLLGLMKPSAGRLQRDDGIVIGYVPQHLTIDRTLPLTVRQFLLLGRRVPTDRMQQALLEVGVPNLLAAGFHDLSGGEVRRVMLARALLRDPDLLVLDEPMANVDVGGQAELYELIQTIRRRRHCGVLLVSHDLHLVMAATDRVLCLNGHVCCSGRPDDVSQHPEYLALFGPKIGESLAVYTHDHGHDHDISGAPVAIDRDTDRDRDASHG